MSQRSLKMVDKYQFNVNKFTTTEGVHEFDAVHVDTRHNYTVRRLALANDSQGRQYARMLNELAVLKKLSSPLVPKCHKLLRTSNNMYHIYDRISGETLQAYLRHDYSDSNWKDKMKSALFMAEQLCGVLAYLYERRICHCQINLQNILVEDEAVSKIVNFSKAKELLSMQEPLEQEESQQSNEYTAPEMQDGKVSVKSDVYSLGVVLQKLFGKLKDCIRNLSHKEKQIAIIESILQFCRNKMKSSDPAQRITAKQALAYFKNKRCEAEREPVVEQRARLLMTDPGVVISHHSEQAATQKRSLSPFSSGLKLGRTQISYQVGSETQEFLYYSKKVLHRRSLSHLLLQLSDFCASLALSSSKCSLPLSFLLIKKSTLIMSQLTKFLDTGRGEGLRMNEKTREKMKKHKKFATLENIIHTQKRHLQQRFIHAAYSLREVLDSTRCDDRLREELQSQTVNKEFFNKCLSHFQSQVYLWSSVEEYNEKMIKLSHLLDKKQLIFLFLLSLLKQYATIGDFFDELFGQSPCSLWEQPFFVEMMQMEDRQIQALILQKSGMQTQKEPGTVTPLGSTRSIAASKTNL